MAISITGMTSLSLLLFLLTHISSGESQPTCSCNVGKAMFKDCDMKNAEWRPHDHSDLGLYDDCLPEVEEK